MKRATLFALTGVGFFVYWLVAKPTFEASPTQGDWPHVLAFTAIILTLAKSNDPSRSFQPERWLGSSCS